MVRVKASSSTLKHCNTIRMPFDEDHLDYFSSLMVQPILALVSCPDEEIWWKPILHKDHYRGPKGGFGITMDTKADRLKPSSAPLLKMLGERSNAMISKYIVEEAEIHLNDIDVELNNKYWDFVTVGTWAQTLASVEREIRDAECLLLHERRFTSEITEIEKRYTQIGERLEIWRKWFEGRGEADLLET